MKHITNAPTSPVASAIAFAIDAFRGHDVVLLGHLHKAFVSTGQRNTGLET